MIYNVVLRPLALIRPSEEVNIEHVEILVEEIIHCQRWITAVPIEKQTGIIMDGNHRYCAAYRLGLACLPCVILDYTYECVSVYHWCNDEPFCPEKIREHIVSKGKIFPYKTTRHLFSPELPVVDFSIQQLQNMPVTYS